MKIKKLALFSFAAFMMAGTAYAANSPFQGFYAEVAAGGINSEFNLTQNSFIKTNDGNPPNVTLPGNTENYDNGGIGSIGVGYMLQVNPLIVLGAEATADVENAKITSYNSANESASGFGLNNSTTNELKNSFAVLFKPGFLLNQGNTLVYGLIGPRWGNFETSSSTSVQVNNTSNATGNTGTSHSGYEIGLALGAGIQQYISNNFSIGLEYQYTDYGNISTPSSSGPVTLSDGTNVASVGNNITSNKAQTNVLTVNLMYHF